MRLTTKEMQKIAEECNVRLSVRRDGKSTKWGFHGFLAACEAALYSAKNRFTQKPIYVTRTDTGIYIQQ